MSGGERLVRDVLLRDGSTLRLRAPGPEDVEAIAAFYDALSPESRYRRFHGFARTDTAARRAAEADGRDRVTLIARQGDRVVATAGYDRLREPGAAEVAFAVADDFQGRGAATRMLEQLADLASEQGVQRFDAEVLADNRPMLGVFRQAGFDLRRRGLGGEVTVSLDIRPSEAVGERIAERDHLGAVASLRPVLAPRSVAVVGASPDPGSLGHAVLANIVDGGFRGIALPVHPDGGVLRSMRVAPSLAELPEPPELVIIAVAPEEVVAVATEAVACGARALVVVSTGAGEDGGEERLLEVVRSTGLRLVGPNCLGVVNTDEAVSLHASLAAARVPPGRLAICSQSGALGIALLGHAAARRLGVSSFASLGHRADVSTNDLLELWEEDAGTGAVMLYVETFGNPERFVRIARRVSCHKPILAVKGRALRPERAEPASHTAAALGGGAAADALLRQAGVLRFETGDDLFAAAEFFEGQPLPQGRGVGLVSNSTGVATLVTDACLARGLGAGGGAERAGAKLLVLAIGAGADAFRAGVQALLADEAVDAVIVSCVELAGGDPEGVLRAITAAASGQDKPVVASVVAADGSLARSGPGCVPNYLFPETCVGVLARAVERREWLSRPLGQAPAHDDLDPERARAIVAEHLGRDGAAGSWLPTPVGEALLASHGITRVASPACRDPEGAVAAAAELGGTVALKADFPPPAHAGDVDAVLLGLHGEDAVRAGWQELERRVRDAGRPWPGVVVQPLVPAGADVLVGTVTDADLGPVMGVGLGGRQAGLSPDVAFRLLPVTDVDAGELVDAAPAVRKQLEGYRGNPPLDREALVELILRFAALVRDVPEVVEGDLNPVRCTVEGCVLLDVRLRIAPRRRPARVKTW